jgi:voltage-gated potassium channel Kch
MKNVKSKITQICGYITFLLGIVGIGFYGAFFYKEVFIRSYIGVDVLIRLLMEPFLLYAVFHYLISTRFWEIQPNELKTLEYQNELLKKEIEKKELLDKLG